MLRSVKFGLNPNQSLGVDALAQVTIAEDLGFDSVWAFERHGQLGGPASPMLYLAAVGAKTKKMLLGADIAILPLYNPVRLAEEVSLLDNMSGGRVILGVGAGYRKEEFQAYGVPFERRGEVMDEALPIVIRLLQGEKVSCSGKFFRVEGFRIHPLPVQKPRPRVWVGGWVGAALRRAALLADAWLPGPAATLADVSTASAKYREYARREPTDRPIIRDVCIAEDSASARRLVQERVRIYRDYASHSHPLGGSRGFSDDLQKIVHGDPAECVRQVQEIVELGFDHIIFRVHHDGMNNEAVVRSITLLAEQVIPSFR